MSAKQKNLAKCISDAYGYMNKKCTGTDIAGVQTHFEDNLVVVRGKIQFTPEEVKFLTSKAGKKLVTQVRMQFLEEARSEMCLKIAQLTGCPVKSSFTDMDLERSEITQIFVLHQSVEQVI